MELDEIIYLLKRYTTTESKDEIGEQDAGGSGGGAAYPRLQNGKQD